MASSEERDVVITGIGLLSALGAKAADHLEPITARAPFDGVARPLAAPAELDDFQVLAAQVDGPDPEAIPNLRPPLPDRQTCMAIVAADAAMSDAALPCPAIAQERTGLVLTTAFGPNETVEQYLRTLLLDGPARVSPITFSRTVANSAAGVIAHRHRLLGPSTVFLGTSALVQGFQWVRRGDADAVLCVGVDALRPMHAWTYRQLGRLATGLRLGEAAAAIVLEAADVARARGARCHARMAAQAARFSPGSVLDLAAVDAASLTSAMRGALEPLGADVPVAALVSLANGAVHLAETERSVASAALPPDHLVLAPKLVTGETFGASGEFGCAVGALWLAERPERRACLVNSCQIGGSVASFALTSSGGAA